MINALIVDDSRLARKRLKDVLENIQELKCSSILEAVDGVDGLNKYKELKPNLIITDIEMPNMDGITMIQEIHKIDEEVNTIVVSSVANEQVKQMIKTDPFTSYFKKPLKENALDVQLLKIKNRLEKKSF